ncbi:hypothetical protein CEXT_150061 [Caerostris extrusa]|uniref:Uncharacterized protein n=1 Tax=Caerostris extrusa TaxID=172846 RepID=A0AAV4ULJ0_CAEEX|nr:hypothetical protein CEXT_150061 [Caerostris extrusa]
MTLFEMITNRSSAFDWLWNDSIPSIDTSKTWNEDNKERHPFQDITCCLLSVLKFRSFKIYRDHLQSISDFILCYLKPGISV